MTGLVVDLRSVGRGDLALAGGKAANLGEPLAAGGAAGSALTR